MEFGDTNLLLIFIKSKFLLMQRSLLYKYARRIVNQ